ncbi:RNA-directed DNA polymerase, eukaryota [Tanacetum coccineum]
MKQEAGSRKQEAGSRKQEAGSRKQEAGSRKQEAGSRKQEAGSRKQEGGSRGSGLGPLLTGSSLLAALFKAREDDERHQESRQDRPDQIMLQQVVPSASSIKEIDIVQLETVNQAELKLLLSCMYAEESKSINFVNLSDHKAKEANKDGHGNCVNKNSKEDVSSSVCSGHFKKYGVPRTGGSILNLMDELVKVGQVMGYKMDGCMSNMTEIIESQGVKEVNFMALQETKMENMELFSVKMCWGNFAFDYVHSDSVGNSGVGGVWCLTVRDLLIIAVYAPHDCRDKQMLWDYLTYEIGKWKGEVVIMGDFNEMSKLDRFLVSENLIYSCPNINAITLERYLSDHRPILLREASFDYGPTPFRYFHYWNEMEGFNKVVEDAWREGPCDKTNAMLNMMMND